MRLRWVVVVSLSCSCTRLNPLFGEEQRDEGSTGGEAGTSASTSKTTTDDSDDTRGDGGSSSLSSSSSTSDPDSTGQPMTSGESSESGNACTLPSPVFSTIDIAPLPTVDPTCAEVWMSAQGPLVVEGDTITVLECGCECMVAPRIEYAITVTGVEIPALPACGHVMAWSQPSDTGCVWSGLAVFQTSPPHWIVSHTPHVPQPVFGGLMVERMVDESCPGINCDAAGTYVLEFTDAGGDNRITMEEAPKLMALPLVVVLDYLVDNVSAVISEGCKDNVVWTALYSQ